MPRAAYRIAFVIALATVPASADEPAPLDATLQCDRAVEPGRVRCTVEARARGGRTLQWADVVLISLPELTQALKGRLGPTDSIARDAASERWAFGLVAKKTGEGEATVRVRAIVCEGDRCTQVLSDAKALIRVGG